MLYPLSHHLRPLWALALGAMLTLGACGGDGGSDAPTAPGGGQEKPGGGETPTGMADVRGTIRQSERLDPSTSNGVLVRFFVEGIGTDDVRYENAWVDVVEETHISFDGPTFAPPTLDDLRSGEHVVIHFTGEVRESWPLQAVAGNIVIELPR